MGSVCDSARSSGIGWWPAIALTVIGLLYYIILLLDENLVHSIGNAMMFGWRGETSYD